MHILYILNCWDTLMSASLLFCLIIMSNISKYIVSRENIDCIQFLQTIKTHNPSAVFSQSIKALCVWSLESLEESLWSQPETLSSLVTWTEKWQMALCATGFMCAASRSNGWIRVMDPCCFVICYNPNVIFLKMIQIYTKK